MQDTTIEQKIASKQNALAWWIAKLSTSRKPSLISMRAMHAENLRKEIAALKGIQFARHCDQQV